MDLRIHGTLMAREERCLVCPEKTSLEISLRRFPQVHHFVHHSAIPGGEHLLKKKLHRLSDFFPSENVHKERQIQQLYTRLPFCGRVSFSQMM